MLTIVFTKGFCLPHFISFLIKKQKKTIRQTGFKREFFMYKSILLSFLVLSLFSQVIPLCFGEDFIPPEYCKQNASELSAFENGQCTKAETTPLISNLESLISISDPGAFQANLYNFGVKTLIERSAKLREMGLFHTREPYKLWDKEILSCFEKNKENENANMFRKDQTGELHVSDPDKKLSVEEKRKLYFAEKLVNLISDKPRLDLRAQKIEEIKKIVGTNGDMKFNQEAYDEMIAWTAPSGSMIDLSPTLRKIEKKGGQYYESYKKIYDFKKSGNKDGQIAEEKRLEGLKKRVDELNKELSGGGPLSINLFDKLNIERRTFYFGKNPGAKIYDTNKVSHHEVYAYSGFGKKALELLSKDEKGKQLIKLIQDDVNNGNKKEAIARALLYTSGEDESIFTALRGDYQKRSREIKIDILENLELICKSPKAKEYMLFDKGLVSHYIESLEDKTMQEAAKKSHCALLEKVDYPSVSKWAMGTGTGLLAYGAISGAPPVVIMGGLIMAGDNARDRWNQRTLEKSMAGFEQSEIQQLLEIARTEDIASKVMLVDLATLPANLFSLAKTFKQIPRVAKTLQLKPETAVLKTQKPPTLKEKVAKSREEVIASRAAAKLENEIATLRKEAKKLGEEAAKLRKNIPQNETTLARNTRLLKIKNAEKAAKKAANTSDHLEGHFAPIIQNKKFDSIDDFDNVLNDIQNVWKKLNESRNKNNGMLDHLFKNYAELPAENKLEFIDIFEKELKAYNPKVLESTVYKAYRKALKDFSLLASVEATSRFDSYPALIKKYQNALNSTNQSTIDLLTRIQKALKEVEYNKGQADYYQPKIDEALLKEWVTDASDWLGVQKMDNDKAKRIGESVLELLKQL